MIKGLEVITRANRKRARTHRTTGLQGELETAPRRLKRDNSRRLNCQESSLTA